MATVAFIGAGSLGFTRKLVRDMLTFPRLRDCSVVLMDIDARRLEMSLKGVQAIIARGNYPATVKATLDRKNALKGADIVVCTILQGGIDVWRHDIEIPYKYGVDINVGDTRGVSGIFRALRTIPVMLDICRDIERICPQAVLLNYTNPMAMLCRAMQRESNVLATGLCHSVQGTAEMLAAWIGAKSMKDITYTCAGINHLAWYIEFRHKGKDALPLIRKAVRTNKDVYNSEQVRCEMCLHLGYFVTESSGHNSEYNWWFRKRPDLIKKYCTHGKNWNPGHHAFILNEYLKKERTWFREQQKWLSDGAPMPLERGHEYAAPIMNALLGGEDFEFNGNLPNRGIITNLPPEVCVEVPVTACSKGFRMHKVGALPPQLAALDNISIAVEEMAVEAIVSGDPQLLFQAVAYDPLTAAVLSLAEIKAMTKELITVNRRYMPQFKGRAL